MDTFTTDATGCVTLPEPLEPGTYYIREMKAVKPYLINGDEIEFDIADDAETQPLTVVRISDERATGSASIVKRCADDSCPWCEEGNAIEGARFIVVAMEDILNPSGSVDMPKGTTVELDPTDESGVPVSMGCRSAAEPLDMRSSRPKRHRDTFSTPPPYPSP